ncbi:MAG: hypothetical protein KKA05_01815, partial [Alphaproteobacteria bacterium]|nr:hypothetical protein [Alphaproteobacteria bacterium]
IYAGWRVQKHQSLQKYRVITARGKIFRYDTEPEAIAHIQAEKSRGLKPTHDHLVLIIPGLNNVSLNHILMQRLVAAQGYDCMIWDYASNHNDVVGHATQLNAALQRLEDTRTISFITHSLGGLILRVLLADKAEWPAQIGRIVMIAPPHGGSFMADLVHDRLKLTGLYQWVCGKVGHDLTTAGAMALPPVVAPVGIIVGGIKHNDGWVAQTSSLIPAATDSRHIRGWPHTIMLWNPETTAQAVHFLRHGSFKA